MRPSLYRSLPLSVLFALLVAIVVPSQALRAAGPATVVTTIRVGGNPTGVAVDSRHQRVFVVNQFDFTLSVINTATNMVIATIPVGYPFPPYFDELFDVAVNPRTDRAYVTSERDVWVIDTTTNQVVTHFPGFGYGIAVNPLTNKAYIASGRGNTVEVLDLTTNTFVASIPVGNDSYDVAVDQGKERAYVVNLLDNTLSVVNTQTNTLVTTIPVGRDSQAVAVDPFANRAYVSSSGDRLVAVIDTTTNTILTAIAGGGGGAAVNAVRHRAYSVGFNEATVIDTSSNRNIASIPVGSVPYAVAVDQRTSRVYVTNYASGTVSVFTGP